MPDLPGPLKGETAGVPNWAIAGAVVAGLGYLWWRKRANSTVPDSGNVASDGSTTPQGQAPAEFLPINPPTPDDTNSGNVTTYSSNADWTTAALMWVVKNAGLTTPPMNPVTAGTAIGDYLQGNDLTQEEANIVNLIIKGIGPPPFPPAGNKVLPPPGPTPKPSPSPTPVPKPKPGPPAKKPPRWYTVQAGDTLSKIGRKFGVSWQAIYNANRDKIKNPNLIFPGQRLLIPWA